MSGEPPCGVRVSLSDGDRFYVLGERLKVLGVLKRATRQNHFVELGTRLVNPFQVTQLTVEHIPSVEIPETLEDN